MLSGSMILLFLLLLATIIYTIFEWKNSAAKIRVWLLVYLILQVLIIIINYKEKIDQNAKIKKLNDNMIAVRVLVDVDEDDPNIKSALTALVDNNFELAKIKILEANKSNKNLHEYLYNKALKLETEEQYSKSKNYLQLCSFIKDKDPRVLFHFAILEQLISQRTNKELIALFEEVINLDPSSDEAHIALAKLFRDNEEYSKAENHFKIAISINNQNTNIVKELAYLYITMGIYRDAVEKLEKLISMDSTDPDNYLALAECYLELNTLDKSMENIEKALILDNYNPEYHKFIATLLENPDYDQYRKNIITNSGFEVKLDRQVKNINLENTNTDSPSLNKITFSDTLDSSHSEIATERKVKGKKYSRIQMTIFNANNRKGSEHELGYLLRKEFGVRFAAFKYRYKYNKTIIFYFNSENKNVAAEFAKRLPGYQKYSLLPNNLKLNIKKYKDIIIILGKDCSDVKHYVKM